METTIPKESPDQKQILEQKNTNLKNSFSLFLKIFFLILLVLIVISIVGVEFISKYKSEHDSLSIAKQKMSSEHSSLYKWKDMRDVNGEIQFLYPPDLQYESSFAGSDTMIHYAIHPITSQDDGSSPPVPGLNLYYGYIFYQGDVIDYIHQKYGSTLNDAIVNPLKTTIKGYRVKQYDGNKSLSKTSIASDTAYLQNGNILDVIALASRDKDTIQSDENMFQNILSSVKTIIPPSQTQEVSSPDKLKIIQLIAYSPYPTYNHPNTFNLINISNNTKSIVYTTNDGNWDIITRENASDYPPQLTTWSPDSQYFMIVEFVADAEDQYIFKGDGTSFLHGEKYLDLTAFVRQKLNVEANVLGNWKSNNTMCVALFGITMPKQYPTYTLDLKNLNIQQNSSGVSCNSNK